MKILTTGAYSDYMVLGYVTDKTAEKMKAIPDFLGDGYADFEIEEIDEVTVDNIRLDMACYIDLQSGDFSDAKYSIFAPTVSSSFYYDRKTNQKLNWSYSPIHSRGEGYLEVSGTDHERVKKVFSERLAWLKVAPVERALRQGTQ